MDSEVTVCGLCHESVATKDIERHLRRELRYTPYECLLCQCRFYSRPDAVFHFTASDSPHPLHRRPDIAESRDFAVETRIADLLKSSTSRVQPDTLPSELQDTETKPGGKSQRETPGDGTLPSFTHCASEPRAEQHESTESCSLVNREQLDSELNEKAASHNNNDAGPASSSEISSFVSLNVTNESDEDILPEPADDKLGFEPVVNSPQIANKRLSCAKCGLSVGKQYLRDHANLHHLRRPLFKCNLCPYIIYNWYSNILHRDHLRRKHQQTGPPMIAKFFTDLRPQENEAICDVSDECFPTQSTKFRKRPIQARKILTFTTPSVTPLAPGTNLCHLCKKSRRVEGVSVSERGNHIMLEHVKKEAVKCRHCDYASPYWTHGFKQIATHIRDAHNLTSHWKQEVEDFRKHLKPEITKFRNICFPSQPVQVSDISTPAAAQLSKNRDTEPNEAVQSEEIQKFPVNCKKCGDSVPSRRSFRNHVMARHLNLIAYSCKLCPHGSKTWKPGGIKNHLAVIHQTKENLYLDHRMSLDKIMGKELDECFGVVDNSSVSLDDYATLSHKEKRAAFRNANRKLEANITLTLPIIRHSPRPIALFNCRLCGTPVNNLRGLKHHAQRHLDQPKFFCKIANCGFLLVNGSGDYSLARHQHLRRVHDIPNGGPETISTHFEDLRGSYAAETDMLIAECFYEGSTSSEND